MEESSSNATPEGQAEYKAVRQEIIKYSEFSVYFQITLFVYLLAQIESWPIFVLFIPLSFYNFKQVLTNAYVLKKEGNIVRNFTTSLSGLAFIQQSCDFSSKILMIFYLETGLSLFIVTVIFGLPFIVHYYYRNAPYTLLQGYLHLLHLLARLIIFLTLILQSIDDIFKIEMSWLHICLPMSIILTTASIMSSIYLVFLFLKRFCKILYEETVIRSNWGLFVCWICCSYSVLSFYYINSLDDNQTNLIVSTALHNINGLFIAFWSLLKLRSFTQWAVEEDVEELDEPQEGPKVELPNKIPRIFKRISGIFYKPVDKGEVKYKFRRNSSVCIYPKEENKETEEKMNISLPVENDDLSMFINEDISLPQCTMCCENCSDAILLPCGHGGICFRCSKRLKNGSKKCHICRKKIEDTVQVKQNSSLAYVSSR